MKGTLEWIGNRWVCTLPKGKYFIDLSVNGVVNPLTKPAAREEATEAVRTHRVTKAKAKPSLSEETQMNVRDIIRRLGLA